MNNMRQINLETTKKHSDVSVVRCEDYDSARAILAVKHAIDLLGGMGAFVKPRDRVLIKPNLLKARPPDAAVTTHPEIVRAVIRLVHEQGGKALVGDSPGIGDLKKVAEKAGILDVVNEEGAQLEDLSDAVQIKNNGRFQHIVVARSAYEADVLINLPKLKTHGMTTLTGAVKNLFGCIPGKRKVQWHLNTGVNHELFMKMLLELYTLLKPGLTIMDAVVGMEGNGPGSGDPRHIGALLAGRDAVSVDAVSAHLVGVKLDKIPLLMAARSQGIGETDLNNITLLGDPLESVVVENFRLPPQAHLEWQLPEWARSSLKNAFTTRPVINRDLCIQCGICHGHCPQGAIEDRGSRLEIRYRDCIRCFCCQEFCPQGAITVGTGWALKLLR
jgi:uncharacterized protein (DUF362 family)/NAD-dependent dihydropyrimidine dehydrogenase PreA subunit